MEQFRDSGDLQTLDAVLEEDGCLEELQAIAVKGLVAWQMNKAMRERKLTPSAMAVQMGISQSEVSRLLNPSEGNVTLNTLQRAAQFIRRKI